MKSLVVITAAAALLAMASAPQSAQAQYYYYPQPQNIQIGVPSAQLGGATINADGSFSNNGYSWNGADPAGGFRGNVSPVYQAARVRYQPVYVAPVHYKPGYGYNHHNNYYNRYHH